MDVLEAKCKDLAKLVDQFQPKLLDLEARSQRLNIKIVDINEGSEEGRPSLFPSSSLNYWVIILCVCVRVGGVLFCFIAQMRVFIYIYNGWCPG